MALLGGLAHCAACGHTLKITGSLSAKTGKRYLVYHCGGRFASGLCPARASIPASKNSTPTSRRKCWPRSPTKPVSLAEAVQGTDQLEEAARQLAAAEHEFPTPNSSPNWAATCSCRELMLANAPSTRPAKP
jgi:hypothetical protein